MSTAIKIEILEGNEMISFSLCKIASDAAALFADVVVVYTSQATAR
jgi:hypothetical protein